MIPTLTSWLDTYANNGVSNLVLPTLLFIVKLSFDLPVFDSFSVMIYNDNHTLVVGEGLSTRILSPSGDWGKWPNKNPSTLFIVQILSRFTMATSGS